MLANRAQFNITDTLIKVLKGGFLKLESPYGSSFVTILPVGKFPVQFNGFHLGEFIQRLNFPVELRIKAEFIDTGKIKGRMGRSNTRYRNIMEEAENTDTVQQDEIIMGSISLKDLMKKVGNKEDIVEYGAYLIVSASSVNQLRQRRQVVLNYFDDMGVYQLLFIIEDQGILKQMYRSMLGVLIDYDQKHNTQLEETLYQYLKFDSNQKAMAESLFMHRNTINYRLNKLSLIHI